MLNRLTQGGVNLFLAIPYFKDRIQSFFIGDVSSHVDQMYI